MLGSAVPMTRSLRCIVPLVAAFVLASCGGESSKQRDPAQRASASSDVEHAAAHDVREPGQDESATVDLKVQIEPRGAKAATVRSPRTSPARSRARAPTSCRSSPSRRSSRRAARPSTRARPRRRGLHLADGHALRGVRPRDEAVRRGLRAVAQDPQERARAGWCSAASASTSRSGCRTPRNEGETQVGDAKTIKISGKADVKQVIADLEKITEKASALNVPGAGGRIPQKLTPEQKRPRPRPRSRA